MILVHLGEWRRLRNRRGRIEDRDLFWMVDSDEGGGTSRINVEYPSCYLKHTLLVLLLFRHVGMRESRFGNDDNVYNDVWDDKDVVLKM
jgi:hypothetical protein